MTDSKKIEDGGPALAYAYIAPEGEVKRHMWTLVGPNGAVHIWAEPAPDAMSWGDKYFGGVEIHSPKRLYKSDWAAEPLHAECWLLKCPCWHDGSSLYFSERIEPLIRHEEAPFDGHVHSFINNVLFDWYQSRFRAEEVA